MKHFIITLLLLAVTPCLTLAQKTKVNSVRQDLSQARTYIKNRNKNYDKAEQLMNGLLKDSANRDNKHIYQVLLESVKGQYDQANERLYLKQKQDTAAFFNLARRMFTVAFTLDSLDMRPDKKGRVNPEYRTKYSSMLNTYRPNIFNGGTFFVRKANWKEAFTFMDTYIDCARQPLFSAHNYHETDKRLADAAYWATYSGYKQHDADMTLRHGSLALKDTAHADFTLQFMAEAYRWKNDDSSYIKTLEEGSGATRSSPISSHTWPMPTTKPGNMKRPWHWPTVPCSFATPASCFSLPSRRYCFAWSNGKRASDTADWPWRRTTACQNPISTQAWPT